MGFFDVIKGVWKFVWTAWGILWGATIANDLTSGELFSDNYDKQLADYEAQQKKNDMKGTDDFLASVWKPKDQLSTDEFLAQYDTPKSLIDNSGPNANQPAENDIGKQLTDKANSTIWKIDFFSQKAKDTMDPIAQASMDAETARSKSLYNQITDKAYNLNVDPTLRNQYAALARFAEERLLDRDGGLYTAQTTKSPEQLKYQNDILEKSLNAYNTNLSQLTPEQLKDRTQLNDALDKTDSQIWVDTVDYSWDLGKQNEADIAEAKANNQTNPFLRAYYHITSGYENTVNEIEQNDLDSEYGANPATMIWDVLWGAWKSVYKTATGWDNLVDTAASFVGNLTGILGGTMWYVVWEGKNLLAKSGVGSVSDVVSQIRNKRDEVDTSMNGGSTVGLIARKLGRTILSHPDDIAEFAGDLLLWWATWDAFGALTKVPVLSDALASSGRIWDVAMKWLSELANGMVINSYFNTMAGQEFGGKWALMDTAPDVLMGGLQGLKWEAANIKSIKNSIGSFKDQYTEAVKSNNGDALKALKDLEPVYKNSFGFNADNFDKIVSNAEASDAKLPDMNSLYESTSNRFIKDKASNISVEEQKTQAWKAAQADTLRKMPIEDAKKAMQEIYGINIDFADKAAKAEAAENIVKGTSNTALQDRYVSLVQWQPDVISKIQSASHPDELSQIIWDNMGGKSVAEFYGAKAKINVIQDSFNTLYKDIISWDSVASNKATSALQKDFAQHGLIDTTKATLTDRGWIWADIVKLNFYKQAKDFVLSNLQSNKLDGVSSENIGKVKTMLDDGISKLQKTIDDSWKQSKAESIIEKQTPNKKPRSFEEDILPNDSIELPSLELSNVDDSLSNKFATTQWVDWYPEAQKAIVNNDTATLRSLIESNIIVWDPSKIATMIINNDNVGVQNHISEKIFEDTELAAAFLGKVDSSGPEVAEKLSNLTDSIKSISDILSMRESNFYESTDALKSISKQKAQNIINNVSLLDMGMHPQDMMNNDELSSLIVKYGKLTDDMVTDMSAVSTKTNIYLQWWFGIWGKVNPVIKPLSEVVGGYKTFFSELSKVNMYQGKREVIDLSEKLKILTESSFSEKNIVDRWYSIGKSQGLSNINSTFVNIITNYDGNQKNFLKEFVSIYGDKAFTPAELNSFKGMLNITDWYRSQYNQHLIDTIFKDGGIDVDKLEAFVKLGGWMGSTDNKLWVVFGGFSLSKRYLYEWNKEAYWNSFEQSLKDFEKSGDSSLQKLAKDFYSQYKGTGDFFSDMAGMYDEINDGIEETYFKSYRDSLNDMDIQHLSAEINTNFPGYKEELADLVGKGDAQGVISALNWIIDDTKENISSRFLLNPYEYMISSWNKENVLANIMNSFFTTDEKFGKFQDTLWVERGQKSMNVFGDMSWRSKILADEYVNKKLFDTFKRQSVDLWGDWVILVSNIDELKDRLKDMFTYGTSNESKMERNSIWGVSNTTDMSAGKLTDDYTQKLFDEHSQVLWDVGDSILHDDQSDVDVLRTVTNNIVANTLSREGNDIIDKMFKETLSNLPDDEYKASRKLIADSYGQMVQTFDDNLSLYARDSKMGKIEKQSLSDYLIGTDGKWGIFWGAVDKLKDKQYQSQFYGQLIETYDKNTEQFSIVMGEWGKFDSALVKWFYPIYRALQNTEDGQELFRKINNLNTRAMGTDMYLDMNKIRAFQALGVWSVEWNMFTIGKNTFEIGSNIKASAMNSLYSEVLDRLNNGEVIGQFSLLKKNFSASEMHTINTMVKSMYDKYAWDAAMFVPVFNKENKLEFASEFIYSFWKDFYDGLKKNNAYRSEIGYNKLTADYPKYIKENVEQQFFNSLSSEGKTNMTRYGLNVKGPTTPMWMETQMNDILNRVGFGTESSRAVEGFLYKGYKNYGGMMKTLQWLRAGMYTMLFNAMQVPKLAQQAVTQELKFGGLKTVVWGLKDFDRWYLNYITKSIDYETSFFDKISDSVDSAIDAFETTPVTDLMKKGLKYSLNAMELSDKLTLNRVKQAAIIGSAQNLGLSPEVFKEYGVTRNVLAGLLDGLSKNTDENFRSVLDPIIEKANNWWRINDKDIRSLNEFIEINSSSLHPDDLNGLLQTKGILESDYNNIIDFQNNVKFLADWYMSSFYHAGNRDMTINAAGMHMWSEFALPLFNWATKELSTNLGDFAMEFSNLTAKYGTTSEMLKSKDFYSELMSMPAFLNLAAQIAQFGIYYRNVNKLVYANSENDEINFGAAMAGFVGPFAAASQILSPVSKAEKTYEIQKDLWVSTYDAIISSAQQMGKDFGNLFLKDAGMIYDMAWEIWVTASDLSSKWFDGQYSMLSDVLLPIILNKAKWSIVKGTMNVYRGYETDTKWYDIGQALNLALYGNFTQNWLENQKSIDQLFVLKQLDKTASAGIFETSSSASFMPNLGIENKVFQKTMWDTGIDDLLTATGDYGKILDGVTGGEGVDKDGNPNYKAGTLFKNMVDTLKWEWVKGNAGLKQMSDEEIKSQETDVLNKITDGGKLDLLSNADDIKSRVLTYRGRFSASFAYGVLLDATAKKYAKDLTAGDKKSATATLKGMFGKSVYSKSLEKKDIDTQMAAITDEFAKKYYWSAVAYNKQVGINATMLAAKVNWYDVASQWGLNAVVSTELFSRAMKQNGNNYVDGMNKVGNYFWVLMKTYSKEIDSMVKKDPTKFVSWMNTTTKMIDLSSKSDMEKTYIKWGMLNAIWDNVAKVMESSPDLAAKYKDVWALVAWNMLDNSNRLTKDAAIKATYDDFWLTVKAGKWASPKVKWVSAQSLRDTALKILNITNTPYKFISSQISNGWSVSKIQWVAFGTTWNYNIKWPSLKWLTTQGLTTKWLSSDNIKLKSGRVTSTKIVWVTKPKATKSYKKTLRG